MQVLYFKVTTLNTYHIRWLSATMWKCVYQRDNKTQCFDCEYLHVRFRVDPSVSFKIPLSPPGSIPPSSLSSSLVLLHDVPVPSAPPSPPPHQSRRTGVLLASPWRQDCLSPVSPSEILPSTCSRKVNRKNNNIRVKIIFMIQSSAGDGWFVATKLKIQVFCKAEI